MATEKYLELFQKGAYMPNKSLDVFTRDKDLYNIVAKIIKKQKDDKYWTEQFKTCKNKVQYDKKMKYFYGAATNKFYKKLEKVDNFNIAFKLINQVDGFRLTKARLDKLIIDGKVRDESTFKKICKNFKEQLVGDVNGLVSKTVIKILYTVIQTGIFYIAINASNKKKGHLVMINKRIAGELIKLAKGLIGGKKMSSVDKIKIWNKLTTRVTTKELEKMFNKHYDIVSGSVVIERTLKSSNGGRMYYNIFAEDKNGDDLTGSIITVINNSGNAVDFASFVNIDG